MVYLDNAATTFPKPESVYVAMDKMNREGAVNAGRGSYKHSYKIFKCKRGRFLLRIGRRL